MGDTKISSLIYADDIALTANTQVVLQEYLKACERCSYQNKCTFAPEKCEVIVPAYTVLAQSHDFGLMCRTRVNTDIKMSAYFKSVGCIGSGYPLSIARKMLHSFVYPLWNTDPNSSTCSKGRWTCWMKLVSRLETKTVIFRVNVEFSNSWDVLYRLQTMQTYTLAKNMFG